MSQPHNTQQAVSVKLTPDRVIVLHIEAFEINESGGPGDPVAVTPAVATYADVTEAAGLLAAGKGQRFLGIDDLVK